MFTQRSLKIKKHSRQVLIFKRSLPVFAFLLASIMMMWPSFFADQKEQFSMALETNASNTTAKVNMESVRFYSQDKKKNPLTITVPKVFETDVENQIITLSEPITTYLMANGTLLTAKTPQGLLYQQEEKLVLNDTVHTQSNTGYQSTASHIICDNKDDKISSSNPVFITGPAGTLKSQGFELWNKGNNLDFTGKTDATIQMKKGKMTVKSTGGAQIRQSNHTLTAKQNVSVTQDVKTITADQMILTYDDKSKKDKIKKIEASGHVIAHNDTHKIKGDKGIYDPLTGVITMSGNVVLYQGNSHIDGETATLNLNTGASRLTPKSGSKKGRVKGRLIPSEVKGK